MSGPHVSVPTPGGPEREAGLAVDDRVDPEPPLRSRRPTRIEVATAILVVGGAFSLLQKVVAPLVAIGSSPALDPVLLVSVALDGLSIVSGVLVRTGRAWILAANLAAIYAFLFFTLFPNIVAMLFGTLYFVVAVAVVTGRGWFDEMGAWRRSVVESRFRR